MTPIEVDVKTCDINTTADDSERPARPMPRRLRARSLSGLLCGGWGESLSSQMTRVSTEGALRTTAALSIACALAALTACSTTAKDTASRGTWVEVRSPRFVLWTNGDAERASRLVADLERFHQVLLRTTNAEERVGSPRLRIFLARHNSAFKAWSGAGKTTAGLFVATERGNFALVDGSSAATADRGQDPGAHILFHEYTHYVMAMQGARVPSWYNEGFAEYMATTAFRQDGSYTLGCPPIERTQWAEHLSWLPIGRVMDSPNVAEFLQKSSARSDSYAQSWYAVHYFSADSERQTQLRRYLASWAGGQPGEAAAQQAFGMSYEQLDALLRDYSQSLAFDCLRINPTMPLTKPRVETRPMSTAEAHRHVGDLLLALFGPTDQALENLEEAAKLAPGDASISIALARVHARKAESGDAAAEAALAKAEEYLKAAEKLAADDAERFAVQGDVHRLRARALRAVADPKATDEVKRARSAYRKAVHRDQTLAEALFGLGLTYLIEDDGAEEGQIALEGAAYLLPLDTQVAAALGSLQLARGNNLQAIAPLQYVLDWSKDEKQRDAARRALEQLRTGAVEAAPAH
jgi:hypothetical protein